MHGKENGRQGHGVTEMGRKWRLSEKMETTKILVQGRQEQKGKLVCGGEDREDTRRTWNQIRSQPCHREEENDERNPFRSFRN